tara:strand:+ start:665 stop:775 length:111 start_codon:yes stop_codon:yes gene_type:complete
MSDGYEQSESQKQLTEHYQAVRNLGEKEKGDKNNRA